MSIGIELVTPELATRWLAETNVANRHYSPRLAEQYSRDMRNDAWQFTGETVSFDGRGHLVDGQHRLQAVIIAGVARYFIIVRGLSPTVRQVVDSGRTRQAPAVAGIIGRDFDARHLAATRLLAKLADEPTPTRTELFNLTEVKKPLLEPFLAIMPPRLPGRVATTLFSVTLARAAEAGYDRDRLLRLADIVKANSVPEHNDDVDRTTGLTISTALLSERIKGTGRAAYRQLARMVQAYCDREIIKKPLPVPKSDPFAAAPLFDHVDATPATTPADVATA